MSFQRRTISMSYPDKPPPSWLDTAMARLEIEVEGQTWAAGLVEISVDVGRREWTDRYAQLCIQCFRRPQTNRYLICVLHPADIAHHLQQNDVDDLDDVREDKEEETFRVKLLLTATPCDGKGFRFLLNGKEWPLHLWAAKKWMTENSNNDDSSSSNSSMSSSSSGSDDDNDAINDDDNDVEEDIFVDGMEEIGEKTAREPEKILLDDGEGSLDTQQDSEPLPELTNSQFVDSIIIPDTDPAAVLKAHSYFDALFRDRVEWKLLQVAESVNGFVSIKRMEVPGHPSGVFMSESIWNDCSVWDVKAIIECIGARKLWDPLLEESTLLYSVSPTCSIWYNKHKGTWPSSPRDYVVFAAQYTSAKRIDLCSTSCTTELFNHQPLPKEVPGFVRANLDVSGWRLERVDASTTSVKLSTQTPVIVHAARKFMVRHGVPPNLDTLERGRIIAMDYDHERKNWRCEYTRPSLQTSTESSSTRSVIRLDRRHGCKYNVVVDPPPSRVRTVERECDLYGIWLDIEHDEEFIIPQRGKILVLIKPHNSYLAINGVEATVQRDTTRIQQTEVTSNDEDDAPESVLDGIGSTIQALPVSPVDQAQAAFAFLKRVDDQQFGWTLISDKNGLRVSKRPGSKPSADNATNDVGLKVPEPFVIYKASKVIECFSLEEVASVVTDIGNLRQSYDETLERIEPMRCIKRGCHVVRQIMKAIFPFKSRELYLCACTAYERTPSTTHPSGDRIFYVESSLPFPSQQEKHPRGNLFISGWILESIDPYTTTTNYPIPSMRATYVVALDLGTSIPSYVSNLVASGFYKKISWIETYLKTQGSPPFLQQPLPAMCWENHKLTPFEDESVEWRRVESAYDQAAHRFSLALGFRCARRKKMDRRGSLNKDADTILAHVIVDLQSFPRGYELSSRLTRDHKDISRILSVQISELAPQPSHLITRKPKKHAIHVTAKLRTGVDYDLMLTLSPAAEGEKEEGRKQLTVNDILGEEDDRWRGVVVVNGREVNVDSDIKVVVNKEDATDGEECSDDAVEDITSSYMTAALGGVSSGVNQIQDFRTRMLLPFTRAASSSFLSKANNDNIPEQEAREGKCQEEAPLPLMLATEISDEPRCSRTKILVAILLLCACLAIVLALLMLQPLETLDVSDNVKPLWRFSVLGGWEIQVIAIHRKHV
ncbi:hypothetical protein DFQ30_005246 [Apophysomyces sp. BC1015]|nr:hypothetical protein DFQ30_005246 [Apophysomyces sp. BC1015]